MGRCLVPRHDRQEQHDKRKWDDRKKGAAQHGTFIFSKFSELQYTCCFVIPTKEESGKCGGRCLVPGMTREDKEEKMPPSSA